mgnify:CR=1 FL=1
MEDDYKRLQEEHQQLKEDYERLNMMFENMGQGYEEALNLYDKAVESSRMKTKFIQEISHEVRTPLNILSGFSQVLATPDIDIPQEQRLELSTRDLKAADVRIATLFFKPDNFQYTYPIDYKGMDIGNEFIVGYGLDYDQQGRNLPDIYKIIE